jgi:hypothetical protein
MVASFSTIPQIPAPNIPNRFFVQSNLQFQSSEPLDCAALSSQKLEKSDALMTLNKLMSEIPHFYQTYIARNNVPANQHGVVYDWWKLLTEFGSISIVSYDSTPALSISPFPIVVTLNVLGQSVYGIGRNKTEALQFASFMGLLLFTGYFYNFVAGKGQ